MERRGFLGAMLAAASAPAIVKAENLMKVFVPKKELILPYGLAKLDPNGKMPQTYFPTPEEYSFFLSALTLHLPDKFYGTVITKTSGKELVVHHSGKTYKETLADEGKIIVNVKGVEFIR